MRGQTWLLSPGAALPGASSGRQAAPPTVYAPQGRLLASLAFFAIHFMGYYIGDTAILEVGAAPVPPCPPLPLPPPLPDDCHSAAQQCGQLLRAFLPACLPAWRPA